MKYLAAFTAMILLLSCNGTKNTTARESEKTQANLGETLQQKQSEGVDFFAKGAIPASWSLEIDFTKIIRFKSLDGADVLSTPVTAKEDPTDHSSVYITRGGSGNIVIRLYKAACTDGLSGEKFNKKVTVDVNGKHYEGCGQYLSDANLPGKWILDKVSGISVSPADFAKGLPEINFDIPGGTISGNDGCNRFTGQMEVQGNGIKFSAIAGTKMACPGNKKENDFVSKISNSYASYYFKGDMLFLYLIDDSVVSFKKG